MILLHSVSMNLVIVRHGESVWNAKNLFTGWVDVELSEKGLLEAKMAGVQIKKAALSFDVVHTSLLTRAVKTANVALEESGQPFLPVYRTWRLNERHYGALQGKDKIQMVEQYGEAQVKLWRRSYDVPPPPVDVGHEHHPSKDARYRHVAPDALPAGECLKDVVARVLPWWHDVAVPQLAAGKSMLVVAHGNSLRALMKHLEKISDSEIAELNVPTAMPRLYQLNSHFTLSSAPRYLDEAAARAGAEAVKKQTSK
jgi:2,3-bisphosphoglycerate-dependent phosphoglycerate mutase